MPNNIKNTLTVYGPPEDVMQFIAKAKGTRPPTGDKDGVNSEIGKEPGNDFQFHKLVPLPPEYSTNPYGDGSPNSGYELEVKTWGVKWGAYSIQFPVVDPGIVTYRFETAWKGPTEFMAKAVLGWPTLDFFLSWGGEGPTRGRWSRLNGKVKDQSERYQNWSRLLPGEGHDGQEDEEKYMEAYDAVTNAHRTAHAQWLGKLIAGIAEPMIAADWFQDREMNQHAAAMRQTPKKVKTKFVDPFGEWKRI